MFHYTDRRVFQQMETHAGTDVFVVLVSPFKIIHMSRQVRVYEAETGIVEHKAHCHSSFIAL